MRALIAALLAVAVAACAGGPQSSPDDRRLNVVTTTTVFADLVRQVGGGRVVVHSLVPMGGEVHTFDPAPSDALTVQNADLLVMNGLGLDEWLLDFVEQAGSAETPVIELAENLEGVQYIEGVEDHDDHEVEEENGPGHGRNPHLWMDPAYAKLYADRIRLKLIEIDAAGQAAYDSTASAFASRLDALEAYGAEMFGPIPAENRRIVSFHDAFPYFAAAYDLELVGVVVEAPGQDPSAGEVAALIDSIRSSGAKAILSETQFDDQLARTIATETGAEVVSDLYTDTLGDSPVDTFEAAIRHDIDRIAAALR